MPGTPHELAALAQRLADDAIMPDDAAAYRWADGTTCDCEEWHDLMGLVGYIVRQRRVKRCGRHQRRAFRLLRSLLSPEQRRTLRTRKDFLVTGSLGGSYRLSPRHGWTERVKRHGSRWFVQASYCFHDDRTNADEAMPNADLAIAHMLLLVADEGEFLARANATARGGQLWNGDYVRRMRQARLERAL